MESGVKAIHESISDSRQSNQPSPEPNEINPTSENAAFSENPLHPINWCCEGCRQTLAELERAAFVLKYQPIFAFFEDWQLQRIEDYMTGEDREDMLPQGPARAAATGQQGTRAAKKKLYLKAEHLTSTARPATIVGVRVDEEAKYGTAVEVKVVLEGRTFFWTLNVEKNPNYGILVDKFGHDENEWKNKAIMLGLEYDDYNETEFPRVTFPAAPTKTK